MELAFQPVTSHAYDLAREEYQEGVFELNLIKSRDNISDKSNLHCSKMHLMRCVSLLENLYYMKQVECIEELPARETITASNKTQLESLSDKLRELYFSDVN